MKKIFSIIAVAAGVIGLTACSDFLDQTSPSEMSTETVYSSPYYTSLRVNKLYGEMGQDRTYSQDLAIVWVMNSDCELVDGLGTNATNTSSERGNMNYNVDPGWSRYSSVWDCLYEMVEDANLVIEGIRENGGLESETSSTREAFEGYLGEALTIRALVYFDLVRYFGDVPLKLESSQSDLSNAYLGKTDRDVIMDTLMNDLEEAIEYLPWAGEDADYTTEHVTKGYAHGLLAQMAMTRAGWAIREEAKSGYETGDNSCDEQISDDTYPTQRPSASERKELYERALEHWTAIIENGTHRLNPSFENEWYLINQLTLDETYYENLFEMPMGLSVTGELGYTVGVRMNGVTTDYGYSNSSGKMKLTAPLLYSYSENDLRRDITCAHFQITEGTSGTIEEMLTNAPFGIYVGKWDCRKMTDEWLSQNLAASAKHMTGINPVKMRYSQVLLYYAECMNELAGGPDANYTGDAGLTAREALALVHNRAFESSSDEGAQDYIDAIASDQDEFFDALVQENQWEFAGEGIRKFDLIRWNLLYAKTVEFKATYLQQLADGTYQETVYFNYTDDTQKQIDVSSITWYGVPEGKSTSDYDGSANSFGKASLTSGTDTQVDTNLPSISGGLVGTITEVGKVGEGLTVKNRYIFPIGSTTISASNGMLSNSYGY